jgi:hypothetical protein
MRGLGEDARMIAFFVLRTVGLVRYFEPSLRLLAERGHMVHIGFPYSAKGGEQEPEWLARYAIPLAGEPITSDEPDAVALLAKLVKEFPNVSWNFLRQQRIDGWGDFLAGLRAIQDYLRYLEPEFRDAPALRDRSVYGALPRGALALANFRILRTSVGRRLLQGFLAACERAIPVSRSAVEEILEVMPDVVLVSRLIDFGSSQVDYVRAAQYLGIPAGLPVASWDNLTNKGLMKVRPDFVTVWNEFQKEEAVTLHGVPEDRVWVTGAQTFDVWFDRKPSASRPAFCQRLGFDPQRRLIVYLCSSRSIAGYEVDIVRRWLRALRGHDDPLVQNASVIVRPHPKHADQWRGVDLSEFGAVEVWPRAGVVPLTDSQRDDFFDTLYHAAAIVGLNTSAQIEAAIVGRPVLVLVDPEATAARAGTLETLHFRHLSDPERGVAIVAQSTPEHLAQLSEAIRRPTLPRGEKFVAEFVRPHGLDRPAAPFLADAIERGATLVPQRPSVLTLPFRWMLHVLLAILRPLTASSLRKRVEKLAVDERDNVQKAQAQLR